MSKKIRSKVHQGPPMPASAVVTPDVVKSTLNELLTAQATDQVAKENAVLQNSFAGAIGYNTSGLPQSGNPYSTQLSNTTTIFRNLRWYLISNFRQVLSEAYVELGLVQAICDTPVDDGLRGGVELKSKQLSEEQISELTISLDRDDDINTAGQAAKWNRLFGGAGILILVGDQDPEEPIDLESIGPDTEIEFRAVDMWELFWDKQDSEGYDPAVQSEDFDFYNYYGEQVHKTRVMRLKGLEAPSFIRPRLRGWGFSVVEILVRSINQYLKATDVAFEVLDEFKVDVFKIKNLVNTLMSPQGEANVRQRIQLAAWQKNYQNALTMDSEDDWDHKQLSFSGLAEVMREIRMQVAADMRMPLSKLFGISATGFNSGEDDIEVYNAMVESQVRNKLKYDLLRICEIKCQKLFGFIPDDLSLAFKPLRVMSAEQEETVKEKKFNRLFQAKQAGEISQQEFRDACNKGNLFDVLLDPDADVLSDYDSDEIGEGDNDPNDPQDIDDPGADRADTKKVKAGKKGDISKEPKAPPQSKDAPDVKPGKDGEPKDVKAKNAADGWDESKHPRAGDGKFGEGGGAKVHHSTYEKFSTKDIKASKGGYFGAGFYVHKDKDATTQYGDETHTYELSDKPVFDLSGGQLKPDTMKVLEEMGLDVEKIGKPSQYLSPVQIAISEIRKKFPGEETVGTGAMEKLRSFLKEKGYIGIQFSHNDTDENMVIFEKKDLALPSKPDKKKNSTTIMPKPFTAIEAARRRIQNSPQFDLKSYEADGGDGWIDERRRELFSDAKAKDHGLWERCKSEAKELGKDWRFVVWLYKKQGGSF